MYHHNSVLIVLTLLVALIITIELGFRIGKQFFNATDKSAKSQINSIQGSILGVLALLLGFTFSLSLQRYDNRSEAVVNEANAIGTAMLRADVLPDSVRSPSQKLIRDYLDLRVQAGKISLDRGEERQTVLIQSNKIQATLWKNATQATDENPGPVTVSFMQSLNEMIDAFGSRDAALNRHVPEVVLFLMFGALILTASLVGYASGVAGHRAAFAVYLLLILILVMVFIIIDLDRPRRGIVEVSQQSLVTLAESN